MSRPQDALLRRLCREQETLTKAQIILHTAGLKTAPGTGYDLRGASTALPAICAYIASEELRNGDVQEKMAQVASCLAPKEFKACLSTVRAALASVAPAPQARARSLTYEGLIIRYKHSRGDFMVSCMREAEKILIENGQLRGRFKPPNNIITIAIYSWVCAVLKLKKVQALPLIQEYRIPSADYQHVYDAIVSTCDLLEKEIQQRVAKMRAEKKAATTKGETSAAEFTPLATPSKPFPQFPSKSVLKSGSRNSSPTKTPTHKRKVAFTPIEDDEDNSAPDTPTRKRPKLSAHSTPIYRTPQRNVLPALNFSSADEDEISFPASSSKLRMDLLQATHDSTTDNEGSTDVEMPSTPSRGQPSTPRRSTRIATNTATPIDPDQTPKKRRGGHRLGPSDEDDIIRPQRCRPILLSHKQWFQQDPRVEMEWRLARSAKEGFLEKYGHPFEHLRPQETVR